MDIMDTDDTKEYREGKRTIIFNLCNLPHRSQTRFMQMYQNAVKNGVSGITFVKTWNKYAEDISEHVFWKIKADPQSKFTERGE